MEITNPEHYRHRLHENIKLKCGILWEMEISKHEEGSFSAS